jgi:hypothetical protein
MRNLLVVAAVVIAAFLVITRAKPAPDPQPGPGHSGSVAISLRTMQTYRTITVTPTSVKCGSYAGGGYPNRSKGAMGFPNGTCSVGQYLKGNDPIKIRYNGFQGYVYVHAGWAEPVQSTGGGIAWRPCSNAGPKNVQCRGPGGKPGVNQYMVEDFSPQGAPTALTGYTACDINFRPARGCYASRGNFQHEGFMITGPTWIPPADTAKSWTVWVIWTAVPRDIRKHH